MIKQTEKIQKRNYAMDFLKGILVILVLYLHTIIFVIGTLNSTTILYTFYNLFAIAIPLFLLISGYFFVKSNNNLKNIYKLIKIFWIYSFITAIGTLIILALLVVDKDLSLTNNLLNIQQYFINLNYQSILVNFFYRMFIYNSSYGYFWFIKNLIYYEMLFYVIVPKKSNENKFVKVFFLIIILLNVWIIVRTNYGGDFYSDSWIKQNALMIIPFFIGCGISKFENIFKIRIKSLKIIYIIFILLFTCFTALTVEKYTFLSIKILLDSFFIFILFLNINLETNPLQIFSKNSLYLLFIQYFYFFPLFHLKLKGDYGYVGLEKFQYIKVIFDIVLFYVILKGKEFLELKKSYSPKNKQ